MQGSAALSDPEPGFDPELEHLPSVDFFRSANAIMVSVGDDMVELLGWTPEELLGRPSSVLIHPEDQNSAVSTWFDMIADPGREYVWRGRYQASDGTWRWVETTNTYLPERPGDGKVRTTMRTVTGDEVTIEERLREREQILSRLADALPVGLFQFDQDRRVTFTNDRLHSIIGETVVAATTDGLFASVTGADRDRLQAALTAVLADQPVGDFEITVGGGEGPVCSLALRALTSRTGEVTGGIGCLSDVTERVELHRHLEHRASIDDLTGCLNRATTLDVLGRELLTCTLGVAVIFIDLDGFKQVNDRVGHAGGDAVLQQVAQRLRGAARAADRVGRIGGDEFLVVCPEVSGPDDARRLAGRFSDALAGDLDVEGQPVDIRGSAGAAWGRVGAVAEDLVADADRDMYLHKPVAT